MKLPVVVLAISVALNLALVATFAAKPALAPTSIRDFFQSGRDTADSGKQASRPKAAAGKKADPTKLWADLHSTDLATFAGRLRAAGFPPMIVRALVDAEIERQFSPRLKEIMREVSEAPFWKPDPTYYGGNSKLFEQVNQIYRERSRVLRELLGKDAYAWAGVDPTTAQRRQFGNIAPEKIDFVQRINDDYAEMMGQVRAAMQGVTLPEDREKLALLEREKRADLAAILTPAELADYEMRTSTITSRLRTAFGIMDASETEFRTIYSIHEPFKDILYPTSSGGIMGRETMDSRREAAKQVAAQVKAALGEQRFAEYQRATDNEYQQLYRIGQQQNIPAPTMARAFDVRAATTETSMKIMTDQAMNNDQKRAALTDLAQNARTQLLNTLGPGAGPAYISAASRWLSSIEQGRAVTIAPDGSYSYRSLPPANMPKK